MLLTYISFMNHALEGVLVLEFSVDQMDLYVQLPTENKSCGLPEQITMVYMLYTKAKVNQAPKQYFNVAFITVLIILKGGYKKPNPNLGNDYK